MEKRQNPIWIGVIRIDISDATLGDRDPFDELPLVQAQEEGLRLLTADRQLADHPLSITIKGRV